MVFSEFLLTICDKEFKLYHRGSKPGTYGVIAFKDVKKKVAILN